MMWPSLSRQAGWHDKANVLGPRHLLRLEFFQSLCVLDISHTDWELDLSQDIMEQMAVNIREVHIKKGRFWCSNLAWRQLQNLRKLRVIEPTSSWETGKRDEFMDMVKLELLDLSGNNAIQVLPSLCGATGLKTLILDGCAGLEHVGLEGLPPSLESFSLDAGAGGDGNSNTAKISRIILAGCAKLVGFRLLGSLPNLEELDLSRTAVKTVDLSKVVQVQNLQKILLMGCERLRAIVWPEKGMRQLRLLHIDTRQEVDLRETPHDSLVCKEQEQYCQARVCIADMRFFQSLVLTIREEFYCSTAPVKLSLYLSGTSKDDGKSNSRGTMERATAGRRWQPF
ncbi:uncharacterized protein LOC120680979 [Panicum virgatum]|uniref:uncharacterized protein LOC120680979 n=1 Tax=Panicum virgatum TaxID=38727 RepID=UPI0019D55185|nr:uncharacterized protein LOC120680979 [Panicum virgatum]